MGQTGRAWDRSEGARMLSAWRPAPLSRSTGPGLPRAGSHCRLSWTAAPPRGRSDTSGGSRCGGGSPGTCRWKTGSASAPSLPDTHTQQASTGHSSDVSTKGYRAENYRLGKLWSLLPSRKCTAWRLQYLKDRRGTQVCRSAQGWCIYICKKKHNNNPLSPITPWCVQYSGTLGAHGNQMSFGGETEARGPVRQGDLLNNLRQWENEDRKSVV